MPNEKLVKIKATKVTLITRPRRFGKTLGMSMLANFFDIRKDNRYDAENKSFPDHADAS